MHMDTAQINYTLVRTIDDWSKIDYGDKTVKDALKKVERIPTRSYRAPHPEKTDLPVIIYHHGAQGRSDENHVMAEYFASRGYLFIAANFHLPYEGLGFGSTRDVEDTFGGLKTVIEYAQSLTSNEFMAFIGHSWGAQSGMEIYLPDY